MQPIAFSRTASLTHIIEINYVGDLNSLCDFVCMPDLKFVRIICPLYQFFFL